MKFDVQHYTFVYLFFPHSLFINCECYSVKGLKVRLPLLNFKSTTLFGYAAVSTTLCFAFYALLCVINAIITFSSSSPASLPLHPWTYLIYFCFIYQILPKEILYYYNYSALYILEHLRYFFFPLIFWPEPDSLLYHIFPFWYVHYAIFCQIIFDQLIIVT